MFRLLFAILLTASLLVCPLRCVSCQPGHEDSVPAGCTCCRCDATSPVTASTQDYPPADSTSDDCTCRNCICEGATLQDGLKLPNTKTQPLRFCNCSAEIEHGIGAAIVRELARETLDCSQCRCGRDARIAHGSWLI